MVTVDRWRIGGYLKNEIIFYFFKVKSFDKRKKEAIKNTADVSKNPSHFCPIKY